MCHNGHPLGICPGSSTEALLLGHKQEYPANGHIIGAVTVRMRCICTSFIFTQEQTNP